MSASSPTIITIETPDWVSCDKSVIDYNLPELTQVTFTVVHNNSQSPINGNIVFTSTSNSSRICNVVQEAAGPVGGHLRSDGGVNVTEQTVYVDGIFESSGGLPQFNGTEWAVFHIHTVATYYDLSQGIYDGYETDDYIYFGNISGETGYRKTILNDGNDNIRYFTANLTISLIDSSLRNRITYQGTMQYQIPEP